MFALDTGTTGTVINQSRLALVGYDPATSMNRVQMTTGSGVEFVPTVKVHWLKALGKERPGLIVIAHTLPPNVRVDGLLGLDFFRGCELRIDFQDGVIELVG